PVGGHARWPAVYGTDQDLAHGFLATVLVWHQAAHGARMVFAAARLARRNRGIAHLAPLRRGDGGPPRRSAPLRGLWRRSLATQRTRGSAAFCGNGVET